MWHFYEPCTWNRRITLSSWGDIEWILALWFRHASAAQFRSPVATSSHERKEHSQLDYQSCYESIWRKDGLFVGRSSIGNELAVSKCKGWALGRFNSTEVEEVCNTRNICCCEKEVIAELRWSRGEEEVSSSIKKKKKKEEKIGCWRSLFACVYL